MIAALTLVSTWPWRPLGLVIVRGACRPAILRVAISRISLALSMRTGMRNGRPEGEGISLAQPFR